MGLGAEVWVHQVLVQCHKQLRALELHCGPALQRDFEPDGSSLDLQEEVSEEDWASPTPEKEHTCKKKFCFFKKLQKISTRWHSQSDNFIIGLHSVLLSGLWTALTMQLAMRGTVMWF